MNLIAAVDKNWAIGNQGNLLIRIREDMKSFRQKTTGKVVVMGRKTIKTFPGEKPLKDRVNIVLTTDKSYEAPGAVAVHSIEELLEELKNYDTEDIFVIGGETVYRQMLPYCDVAYITYLDREFEADAWIENLDEAADWECIGQSEIQRDEETEYQFCKYKKLNAAAPK